MNTDSQVLTQHSGKFVPLGTRTWVSAKALGGSSQPTVVQIHGEGRLPSLDPWSRAFRVQA